MNEVIDASPSLRASHSTPDGAAKQNVDGRTDDGDMMEYSEEALLRQSPKPEGALGRIAGKRMNERHAPLWKWGLSLLSIAQSDVVLDVGCGGGEAVKLLSGYSPEGSVFGIDHSEEMVKLAQEVNCEAIKAGRVQIFHGSVSKLPFQDGTFNLVTAFETYGFWPDIENDLKEVRRVLKPDGKILVVHSAYRHEKYEARNAHWMRLFNMRIDTPRELHDILCKSGYCSIEIVERVEDNWIAAIGRKAM